VRAIRYGACHLLKVVLRLQRQGRWEKLLEHCAGSNERGMVQRMSGFENGRSCHKRKCVNRMALAATPSELLRRWQT